MEIYRLKDDVEKGGEVLRVTELKAGVKNPERVNVFVNGAFSFSLDVAQVVDLGVKMGRVLSEEELAELKKASEFGKLYQRALEKALTRPHSEREIRDYLWRKLHGASSGTASRRPVFTGDARLHSRQQPPKDPSETPSELSQRIVQRLIERGYVDDRRFAEFWVENRFVKKGVSRKRLEMELIKKGVSREIIGEVLEGRDDREEILKMIAKKRGKYDDERLMAYLCRQGFSYDLVRELVEESGRS
ncbi:RecX family transcriptional regulator [Candidatus Saccharibacteria bacterium]|nr:RecX family transcriptional regulator [Candidatus Saccharibacteria bacterium]